MTQGDYSRNIECLLARHPVPEEGWCSSSYSRMLSVVKGHRGARAQVAQPILGAGALDLARQMNDWRQWGQPVPEYVQDDCSTNEVLDGHWGNAAFEEELAPSSFYFR